MLSGNPVHPSVNLSIHPNNLSSISPYVHPSCFYPFVHLCTCPSGHITIRLSTQLSICLTIHPFMHIVVNLSINLSVQPASCNPSIHMFIISSFYSSAQPSCLSGYLNSHLIVHTTINSTLLPFVLWVVIVLEDEVRLHLNLSNRILQVL